MGKGKGTPEFWVCRVKPGKIMFELDGVTEESAKEAFSLASAKLPLETKFVKNTVGLIMAKYKSKDLLLKLKMN